ncbi:glutathione S-transferase [Folsomia candida]|nr:glutathione S-transferase [Folsomia candida]
MSKPVFGYHDLRGIAHPIKFALAYLGVDYVDKRYPLTPEGLTEYGGEKGNLGLDFPNLPYWKDGTVKLTESRAVLKYIARKQGGGALMPKDEVTLANAEMVEGVLWDVWYYLIWRCKFDNDTFIDLLKARAPAKLDLVHTFLGNKKWILGDQISYVDFMLYEVLHGYSLYDPEFLKPYPGLLKLKANFEEIPQIKKFIASPEYIKGPCYHPTFMKHKVPGLTC